MSTMQVLEQTFGVEVKVYDDCCHFDDWKPNQETLLKKFLNYMRFGAKMKNEERLSLEMTYFSK